MGTGGHAAHQRTRDAVPQRVRRDLRRLDFESDQMLLFAVVRAIEVLGEAAGKVSEDTRSACPEIPWPEIASMRNRLIHGYFDIDIDIVWNTASIEVPALLADLRRIAHAQT